MKMATYKRRKSGLDLYNHESHKTVCDAFRDDFDARTWWRAVATAWLLIAAVAAVCGVILWVIA